MLTQKGIISVVDSENLYDSYIYFRKIEHLLQIYEDQQVHAIPDNTGEIAALAKRLDISMANPEGFKNEVRTKMSEMHTLYQQYFKSFTSS